MKRRITFIFTLIAGVGLYAQTDTLTSHFTGTPTFFTINPTGGQSGFVFGHNTYLDEVKAQKFDSTYGSPVAGTIDKVLFWVDSLQGNPNSTVNVNIYGDNGGTPGTLLGSTPVSYSSIASVPTLISGVARYNAVATFTTPIIIPNDQVFYAGVEFLYAVGDSLGLMSTSDIDFPDATTHTWERWQGNWGNIPAAWTGLDAAIAIFPVVTPSTPTGIIHNEISSLVTISNQGNNIFQITTGEGLTNGLLTVTSNTGQTVQTQRVNSEIEHVYMDHLAAGVYLIQGYFSEGNMARKIVIQ